MPFCLPISFIKPTALIFGVKLEVAGLTIVKLPTKHMYISEIYNGVDWEKIKQMVRG